MRVKCLAKEHNAMPRPGLEPRPLDPETSTPGTHQATTPILWTSGSINNKYCTHAYLYSLRSINMNESNLRVNGLPNVTAVWIDYFLLMKVKQQQLMNRSVF